MSILLLLRVAHRVVLLLRLLVVHRVGLVLHRVVLLLVYRALIRWLADSKWDWVLVLLTNSTLKRLFVNWNWILREIWAWKSHSWVLLRHRLHRQNRRLKASPIRWLVRRSLDRWMVR